MKTITQFKNSYDQANQACFCNSVSIIIFLTFMISSGNLKLCAFYLLLILLLLRNSAPITKKENPNNRRQHLNQNVANKPTENQEKTNTSYIFNNAHIITAFGKVIWNKKCIKTEHPNYLGICCSVRRIAFIW